MRPCLLAPVHAACGAPSAPHPELLTGLCRHRPQSAPLCSETSMAKRQLVAPSFADRGAFLNSFCWPWFKKLCNGQANSVVNLISSVPRCFPPSAALSFRRPLLSRGVLDALCRVSPASRVAGPSAPDREPSVTCAAEDACFLPRRSGAAGKELYMNSCYQISDIVFFRLVQ